MEGVLAQIHISAAVLTVAVATLSLIERLCPAERGQSLRATVLNLQVMASFVVMTPILMALVAPMVGAVRRVLGGPLFVIGAEGPVPTLAATLGYLLLFDLFYYWLHRVEHAWPVLWEEHKLHHSTPALNATAAAQHWLDEPLKLVAITVPMGLLVTFEINRTVLLGVALTFWGVFQHANTRIGLGPLTPVVAGPQFHRIHHSLKPEHTDRNFAFFFPVWDIVFGTYHRPKKGEWPATGLLSGEIPSGFWQANLWPFIGWWKMLRPSAVARSVRLTSAYRKAAGPRGIVTPRPNSADWR